MMKLQTSDELGSTSSTHFMRLGLVGSSLELDQFAKYLDASGDTFQISARADRPVELCDKIFTVKLDCLLVEGSDALESETQMLNLVRRSRPNLPIVLVSGQFSLDHLWITLLNGYSGYLIWEEISDYALHQQLMALQLHQTFLTTPQVSTQLAQLAFRPAISEGCNESLTSREREILRLLSADRQYKEIADCLSLSLNTIRSHIQRIYRKLEVSSKSEALKKLSLNPVYV